MSYEIKPYTGHRALAYPYGYTRYAIRVPLRLGFAFAFWDGIGRRVYGLYGLRNGLLARHAAASLDLSSIKVMI